MKHCIGVTMAFEFLLAFAGCQLQSEAPHEPKASSDDAAQAVAVPVQPRSESLSSTADEELKFEELVFGKMQQKVAWHLANEKLEDVIGRVRKALGVNVVLDKNAFEFSPANASTPINQDFDGVTLELALDLVLRPYQLDWTVVGNAVLISSHDTIEQTLVVRVYDVEDLVAGGGFDDSDVDSLIDAIVSNVSTDTWAENGGGEADVRPFRVHGKSVLIVTQSRRAHQQIRRLLNDLRTVHGKTPPQVKTPLSGADLREKLGVLQDSKIRASAGPVEIAALSLESDELRDAVRRNNQFSVDLFRNLAGDARRNDLVSGYSAREVLLLAALGANGETKAEFAEVLRLPDSRMTAAIEALSLRSYVDDAGSSGSDFTVANSLWVQRQLKVKDDYSALADKFMGAAARPIDFRRGDEAIAEINRWAAENTRQRIPKILEAQDVSPKTYLVLANAVYFLGKWQMAFEAKKKAVSDFMLADGEKAQVEMMNGEMRARYGLDAESGLQVAELPYRGKTKSLVVLLPAKGNNALTKLKQQLDSENLEEWIAATKLGDVKVRLPKFSFRVSHDLNESLAAMGGQRMFDFSKGRFFGNFRQSIGAANGQAESADKSR